MQDCCKSTICFSGLAFGDSTEKSLSPFLPFVAVVEVVEVANAVCC